MNDRMDELERQLRQRHVDAEIIALLLSFAVSERVEACNEEAPVLGLSPDPDAYVATYVRRSDLSIALDTEDARRMCERYGLRFEDRRGPTAFVHVSTHQVREHEGVVLELLRRAFDRAFQGPRWQRGPRDRQLRRGEVCPTCHTEASVVGECAC